MPRYLLPCPCGQSISIDTIQAGQEVRCSCGESQLAPTLREIRQLPEAEQAMTQVRLVKDPWSASRTIVFAIGLVVTALAMGAVSMCQVKIWPISAQLPTKAEMKAFDEDMNVQIVTRLTAEQSYEQFLKWKEDGLGEQMDRLFEVEHKRMDKLKLIRLVFLVVMGIGLLVAGVAALWPRRRVESVESS